MTQLVTFMEHFSRFCSYFYRWAFIAVMLLQFSCEHAEKPAHLVKKENVDEFVWYQQTRVHLGKKIEMLDRNFGYAISSGMGDIPGHVYKYENNRWISIEDFPYADGPQLHAISKDEFLYLHDLVHTSHWKPEMFRVINGVNQKMSLPRIMWDDKDFVIMSDMEFLPSGRGWMVGQQGNILKFDGEKWKSFKSPLQNKIKTDLFFGDLNDLYLVNDTLCWAVGKAGTILRFNGNKWQKMISPAAIRLNGIWGDANGDAWAVGNRGVILHYIRGKWQWLDTDFAVDFKTVKGIPGHGIWICGSSSTLLNYDQGIWKTDQGLKNYEDYFMDFDWVVKESHDLIMWVIGNRGIYSNDMDLALTFSNITTRSKIRRDISNGRLVDINGDDFIDLMAEVERGQNIIYINQYGNTFIPLPDPLFNSAQTDYPIFAAGDVNRDGYTDLFEFHSYREFRLLLGQNGASFVDFTKHSNLYFPRSETFTAKAAQFVDIENDGDLDLYITTVNDGEILQLNNGVGQFALLDSVPGLNKWRQASCGGVTFSDLNNDGLVDLLFPYHYQRKGQFLRVFINEGNYHFHELKSPQFFRSPNLSGNTSACLTADFDNNGWMDIFVYNLELPPALFFNNGNLKFIDVSRSMGFDERIFNNDYNSGVINTGDFDNDGWVDLMIGGRLFLNRKTNFVEVTEKVGLEFNGTATIADFDIDGDMDFIIGGKASSLGEEAGSAFYRNNIGNGQHFILDFSQLTHNIWGIGAEIRFSGSDKSGKSVFTRFFQHGFGLPAQLNYITPLLPVTLPRGLSYSLDIKFPDNRRFSVDHPFGRVIVKDENFYLSILEKVRQQLAISWHSSDRFLLSVNVFFWNLLVIFFLFIKRRDLALTRKLFIYFSGFLFYLVAVLLSVYQDHLIIVISSFGPSLFYVFSLGSYLHYHEKKKKASYISHFNLLNLIGKGGMGKVYLAKDTLNGEEVAIKLLPGDIVNDEESRIRFSNEGQILKKLDHRNIVKIIEIGENKEYQYIAMEYLKGELLSNYIDPDNLLSEKQIGDIVLQLCTGLTYIHSQGIIHRDIKPNNILLSEKHIVKLMDFGLSRGPLMTSMVSTGNLLGTLGYISPEQISGGEVGPYSDIFSLGVVLYEILTGHRAFTGENEISLIHAILSENPPPPQKFRKGIQTGWNEIIEKCIHKDIDERYSNTTAMQKDITKIIIE